MKDGLNKGVRRWPATVVADLCHGRLAAQLNSTLITEGLFTPPNDIVDDLLVHLLHFLNCHVHISYVQPTLIHLSAVSLYKSKDLFSRNIVYSDIVVSYLC